MKNFSHPTLKTMRPLIDLSYLQKEILHFVEEGKNEEEDGVSINEGNLGYFEPEKEVVKPKSPKKDNGNSGKLKK